MDAYQRQVKHWVPNASAVQILIAEPFVFVDNGERNYQHPDGGDYVYHVWHYLVVLLWFTLQTGGRHADERDRHGLTWAQGWIKCSNVRAPQEGGPPTRGSGASSSNSGSSDTSQRTTAGQASEILSAFLRNEWLARRCQEECDKCGHAFRWSMPDRVYPESHERWAPLMEWPNLFEEDAGTTGAAAFAATLRAEGGPPDMDERQQGMEVDRDTDRADVTDTVYPAKEDTSGIAAYLRKIDAEDARMPGPTMEDHAARGTHQSSSTGGAMVARFARHATGRWSGRSTCH